MATRGMLPGQDSDAQRPELYNVRSPLSGQALQNQYLIQEVQSREEERWELLSLLSRKDERLHAQELASEKQRAVLQCLRETASYYRALCAFRAWGDVAHRTITQRALAQAKRRLTTSLLKQVCRVIFAGVRNGVKRQTKVAFDGLWLNAAMTVASKELDGHPPTTEQASLCTPPRRSSPTRWQEVLTASPGPPKGRACRPTSPCRASEASTCMPMSSPRAAHASGTASPATLGSSRQSSSAATLILVIQKAQQRRVGLAWRRWCIVASHRLPPVPTWTACKGSASSSIATTPHDSIAAQRSNKVLPNRLKESCRAATSAAVSHEEQTAALRARCLELEGLALRASGTEAVLRNQVGELQALHAEEALAYRESQQGKLQVSQELLEWQARCEFEQNQDEALRLRAAALAADAHRWEEKEGAAAARLASVSQQLQTMQEKHSRAEVQLATEAQWREEAERRIKKMVSRGEVLERERARLMTWQSQSRQKQMANSEECEALQQLVRHWEQANAKIERAARVLEESNNELAGQTQAAERKCATLQEKHTSEKVAMLQDLAELRAEMLTSSSSRWSAEERAAEAARAETWRALTRERGVWASEISKLNSQFQDVRAQLASSKQQEEAEALALERAISSSDARLKEEAREGAVALQAARAELAEEALTCDNWKVQLAREVTKVKWAQDELAVQMETRHRAQAGRMEQAVMPVPTFAMSSDVPPRRLVETAAQQQPLQPLAKHDEQDQMDELDAYARLAQRLQAEILWERDERESSARSLESVRSSYGLLLERTNAAGAQDGREAAAAPIPVA